MACQRRLNESVRDKMKKFKYVAVIGVDGMGNFNKFADTPNFDRIFKGGAVTYNALSLDPTISAENWGGMLIGADPVVHGLTNSIADRYEYTNEALPSVFKRIRKAMPDAYLASCVNWGPINHGIIEHDQGVKLIHIPDDARLIPQIVRQVYKKPAFLFVQLDEVDGAGHGHGYGTPEHLRQIEKEDKYIGTIYDAYEKAGILQDTLFTVIADHGGYNHGHGGYTDGEKYVFFGASGRNLQRGGIGYMQTKDISAIVLTALGIDLPGYDELGFSSQVPDGLFKDIDGAHRKLEMKEYKKHLDAVDPDAKEGIYSFIDKSAFACGYMFEGKTEDFTGKLKTKEKGHVKYYNIGVRGESGEPGENGYGVTSSLKLGKGFTVSVWIKKDKAHRDTVVVAATNERNDMKTPGFSVGETIHDARIRLYNGEVREDFTAAFPADMESGWVHYAASFDNVKCEVKIYINFRLLNTYKVDESFKGFAVSGPLYIGEDSTGRQNTEDTHCNTMIDDLFIFNRPLEEKEIKSLAEYYGD